VVITAAVGIGRAGSVVIRPDDRRHVEIAAMAEQPERRGEMRFVRPAQLGQAAIEHAACDRADLGFGHHRLALLRGGWNRQDGLYLRGWLA
jgi:hypothetical protein